MNKGWLLFIAIVGVSLAAASVVVYYGSWVG